MATSMLRLGRLGTLKCLQQDGWGFVRTPLTAAFCTKTETPKKPAKKASSKKAPAAPAPEPFDNTTYKNLQHHNYNTYTFVDVDVEMAKYRLPQPSTGRPSPRH